MLSFSEYDNAIVRVHTLGRFEVFVEGKRLNSKDWGRDKSIQLFQFLLMARNRKALHKDQIVDRLWEDDLDDQTFKVALHGIGKALEPRKKSHAEAKFVQRVGQTYQLNASDMWIDTWAFETRITQATQMLKTQAQTAIEIYRTALDLHQGVFLPERVYEDWSCDERERLQLLFLETAMSLGELVLATNPVETIQLCQEALLIDVAYEEAYRLQMQAYFRKGNRPMAIKTYQACEKALQEELGIRPLPETRKTYQQIIDAE